MARMGLWALSGPGERGSYCVHLIAMVIGLCLRKEGVEEAGFWEVV